MEDDDAASDVSCLSDRKGDTEGEETDTAPEAEAVNNDDQFDHYGDYVTRCIWYVIDENKLFVGFVIKWLMLQWFSTRRWLHDRVRSLQGLAARAMCCAQQAGARRIPV